MVVLWLSDKTAGVDDVLPVSLSFNGSFILLHLVRRLFHCAKSPKEGLVIHIYQQQTMSSSDSVDKAPEVVSLGIPLIIIPTVAVALRIWSRTLIATSGSSRARVLWWDDWLILICLVRIRDLVYMPAF